MTTKKTLSTVLFIALAGLIIFSSLSFVSASSELCRGVDGYYGDCSSDPWRYQGSKDTSRSSGSSSNVFRGANAEVYQFNSATRDNKPSNYADYYSPSYPVSTGAMPYFTGGYAGYNQGYGYGMYDYGLGYGSSGYDYSGYGGYGGYGNYGGYGGYPGYGYGGYGGYGNGYSGYGYGYGTTPLDYGLGIASQYATPEGRQWLGVASMIQQFFWL